MEEVGQRPQVDSMFLMCRHPTGRIEESVSAAARMLSARSRASFDMRMLAGILPACFSRRASFATHTAVAVRSSPANASAGINAITTARATLMAYTAAGTVSGFGTAEDDVAGAIGSIGALMNA